MYKKYPRTLHHPMSLSVSSDDKIISSLDDMIGRECFASIKMDGECTTIYPNAYTHARSTDSKYHPSRTHLQSFAASIAYKIPEGLRVCGENCYAQHSLAYTDLRDYFLGFSVWDDEKALSLDDTLELFEELGVTPVEIVWRGILTQEIIDELWAGVDPEVTEGLVFRVVDEVPYEDFGRLAFKIVRDNHVQTNKHWSHQEVVPNELAKS